MSLPRIGQRLYVDRTTPEGRGHARLLDIADLELYVDEPLEQESHRRLDIVDGDHVRVTYRDGAGALYQFETVTLKRLYIGKLAAYALVRPNASDIVRIQRRSFVRVHVGINISFLLIVRDESPALISGKGMTQDISGGGMSFYPERDYPLHPGDTVSVKFTLPGEAVGVGPISAKGLIIRRLIQADRPYPLLAIRFTESPNTAQQRIVQFAFKRQIELRTKGLERDL